MLLFSGWPHALSDRESLKDMYWISNKSVKFSAGVSSKSSVQKNITTESATCLIMIISLLEGSEKGPKSTQCVSGSTNDVSMRGDLNAL